MIDFQRRKRLSIAPELLLEFLTPGEHRVGAYFVDAGVPAGATVILASMRRDPPLLDLVLVHESFARVPNGDAVPEITPVITKVST